MLLFSLCIILQLISINKIFGSSVENEDCGTLQNKLASGASNFTSCAILNSRPITLCEICVDQYMEVITTYKEMANLKINDTSCLDYFTNQDRLGIVNSLYEDAKNLWNKAKCYECFNFENGEMTNNLSSQTVKFLTYYNETMNCINTTGLQSNITSVCNNCMQKYITLDEYYQSISNENEQIGVCMDIVDLMNNTRKYWSENCCKFRKHDETIFLVSAGGVLFLTVMFYAITHWCAERKIPTILQQPRFVESLNNMTT